MEHLDIAIESGDWDAENLEAFARLAIGTTLEDRAIDPELAEVSLLACDDARIAELNQDFRGKPTPTNVLSWPSEERAAMSPGGEPTRPNAGLDGLIELGDIAISYDTCAREARVAGKPLDEHLIHLIVHATLHLLGYDHETEPDAAVMEGLEIKILGKLGLDDPYRES